ncbi:type II secretion system protein GspI [Acinetobacter junii]|nr:type II secretion system protein GspI [Acinetobacter junii]
MKINTSNKMTNRQFSLLDKKSDSLNFQTIAEVKLDSLKIQKGFTLLEVMVALAIFAVAAIALTKIAMQYTQSTSNAILRTKAQFVAMNEIATMEINQEWLEGIQSKQVTAQGETWQIDKKAQSTLSPKIQRIELQVSLYNIEQGKVEAGITNLVFFNYPAKVKTS